MSWWEQQTTECAHCSAFLELATPWLARAAMPWHTTVLRMLWNARKNSQSLCAGHGEYDTDGNNRPPPTHHPSTVHTGHSGNDRVRPNVR